MKMTQNNGDLEGRMGESRWAHYLDGERVPSINLDEIAEIREDAKTDPIALEVYSRYLRSQEEIERKPYLGDVETDYDHIVLGSD